MRDGLEKSQFIFFKGFGWGCRNRNLHNQSKTDYQIVSPPKLKRNITIMGTVRKKKNLIEFYTYFPLYFLTKIMMNVMCHTIVGC